MLSCCWSGDTERDEVRRGKGRDLGGRVSDGGGVGSCLTDPIAVMKGVHASTQSMLTLYI